MLKSSRQRQRILSIDILRGLDLFFLLFLQPVVLAVGKVYDAAWYQSVLYQLDHEVWEGFRCWDLVMPLFLFMVGASMPFSFARFREGAKPRRSIYARIARRVVILFLLGMIVQGNLLAFRADALLLYNNTLQAIAAGYLIAAVILLNCNLKTQIIVTFALLVIYSVPMAIYGSYLPGESFAFEIDRLVLGDFRGDLTYTWVWSSLTFGATVMFGAIAGTIIKRHANGSVPPRLLAWGLALIALGIAGSWAEPIIKRIWTSTMTLYSAGWCMLLMALFYWITDVLHCTRGLMWLKIYGTNAITAYCIGEVISFRSVVYSLTYGLEHIVGQWYGVILTFGNAAVLFLILYFMYRYKIFLKV